MKRSMTSCRTMSKFLSKNLCTWAENRYTRCWIQINIDGASVIDPKGQDKTSWYLVGDLPCVMFEGELWQRHLWPPVQRVVCMVIVALLKEGVVSCLATIRHGKWEAVRTGWDKKERKKKPSCRACARVWFCTLPLALTRVAPCSYFTLSIRST